MSAGIGAQARVAGVVAAWGATALLGLAAPAGAAAAAPPEIIVPFAGTGAPGAVVPGPATASPLGSPEGLALDAAGNLYIADAGADEVLRVTPAGALSVVAGTGTAGPAVPGAATASDLNAPSGVAVDRAGNVYIADTGNAEVEEVTPGGTLSIIAGTGSPGAPVPGPAAASPLGGPAGVAVDAAGDVFIADGGSSGGSGSGSSGGSGGGGNPDVEEVSPAGTLSIFAGTGTAGLPVAGPATSSPLTAPVGVAVDSAGDVYIADRGAGTVDEVTAPGGTLSVIAGVPGTAGPSSPGTATQSDLNAPSGVAVDAEGTVYIANTADNRVEKVTAGQLAHFAGNGRTGAPSYWWPAGWSATWGPEAVAAGSPGFVDVADTSARTVDRIVPAPPVNWSAPVIAGAARQDQPLTARPGRWLDRPAAYAYQWQLCPSTGTGTGTGTGTSCTDIPGATATTYTPAAAQVGERLRVAVTATNIGGSATAVSAPTAAVLPLPPASTSAPVIAGRAVDGQTLTVSPGGWRNGTTTFRYQWEECGASGAGCATVSGATTDAYALAPADVGSTLRVLVTAVNAGGSTTATTAPSAVISPALVPWANIPAPEATRAPAVSGTPAAGQTLACDPGTWTGDPSFAYQWDDVNMPIAGATSPTYVVQPADAGRSVSCSVIAANAGGTAQADSVSVAVAAGGTGDGAAAGAGAGGIRPCVAARGRLSGARLGALTLGDTRGQARRLLGGDTTARAGADSFCLANGGTILAAYTPAGAPAGAARTARAGGASRARGAARAGGAARVAVAITTTPSYALDGIRVGMTASAAAHHHRLGHPLRAGGLSWYVLPGARTDGLVAVYRNGTVAAVGTAARSALRGRSGLRRLLRRLPPIPS